jgi:CRISPR/Cas system endoribonuclease Cas6 (RAMP superfamily)
LLVGDILNTEIEFAPKNLMPLISRKYSKEVCTPFPPLTFFLSYLVLGCWRDWGGIRVGRVVDKEPDKAEQNVHQRETLFCRRKNRQGKGPEV